MSYFATTPDIDRDKLEVRRAESSTAPYEFIVRLDTNTCLYLDKADARKLCDLLGAALREAE